MIKINIYKVYWVLKNYFLKINIILIKLSKILKLFKEWPDIKINMLDYMH